MDLSDWYKKQKKAGRFANHTEAAEFFGVKVWTFRWMLRRGTVPPGPTMVRIHELTDGAVTIDDWAARGSA